MEGLYLQYIYSDTAVFPNRTTERFTASQIHPLSNYEECGDDKEAEAKPELPAAASTSTGPPTGISMRNDTTN